MIIRTTGQGSETWEVLENGNSVSRAGLNTVQTRFGSTYLQTVTVGGVETEPEYRRKGYVRKIFEKIEEIASERGWAVGLLHPFSFAYYRKFGYEKVADHKILEFPMKALDFVPRVAEVKVVRGGSELTDALTVFEKFSEHRNCMFARHDAEHYNCNPNSSNATYLWYDEQHKPAAYVTLGVEKKFVVNHMESVNLNVYEIAFTTPASLTAILGFFRMYEGELDSVKIFNCAMSPEIDFVLRHYTHTKYTIVPDMMARIYNVQTVLKANSYPKEKGHFTIKVEDSLSDTKGIYTVEYESGVADIKKREDTASYDLAIAIPALTQILYGYEAYTPENAIYLAGVHLEKDTSDFFRAFPKKTNGLFEHF